MPIIPIESKIATPQSNETVREFLSADEPIVIDETSDFGALGFPGDGSSGNPYRISGISIAYEGICLQIDDVNAFIEISDCNFTRLNPFFYGGSLVMDVSSVTNLSIINCQITNGSVNAQGCDAFSVRNSQFNGSLTFGIRGTSTNSSITKNTFVDCEIGVLLHDAYHVVYDNVFIRNGLGIDADTGEYYNNLLVNCSNGIDTWYGSQIYNNNITGFENIGIDARLGSNVRIENNWILGDGGNGIMLRNTGGVPTVNNTLIDCGFNGDEIYEWAHDFQIENNTINNKPFGFFENQTELAINGTQFCQVILFKCSNTTISNGTFSKLGAGITTLYSTLTIIDECNFTDCVSGLTTIGSSLLELSDCIFTNGGLHTQGGWSGLTIDNCIVNGKPLTLLKHEANITLNCDDHGQIIASDCANLTISGGSISDASVGITVAHSTNSVIENADVSSNSVKGIYLANTEDCEVRLCNLTENGIGLYMVSTVNNLITNNTISHNGIGVRTFGTSNSLYYNTFHNNSGPNAFEGLGANTWDDSISMGNWWNDYSGQGIYYVDFDYGCLDFCPIPIDRFPNGVNGDPNPPEINHPVDIQIYEGAQFTIEWTGIDDNPFYYYVYVNGSLYESDYWWNPIEVDFRFYNPGYYNVTIMLEDRSMNTVIDLVIVHVIETLTTTSPTTTWNQTLAMMSAVLIVGTIAVVIIAILLKKNST